MKLSDIDNIIYELIMTDRHYKIANEDLEVIESIAHKVHFINWNLTYYFDVLLRYTNRVITFNMMVTIRSTVETIT